MIKMKTGRLVGSPSIYRCSYNYCYNLGMPNFPQSIFHSSSQNKVYDLFSSRRFRFGFVCFKKSATADTSQINFWNQLVVNEYILYVHPETTIYQVTGQDGIAVFIGDVFVCATDQSVDELTLAFLNNEDWDAFDCLSGRFALLIFSHQGGKVLHDPFGARSIFYRESGDLCIGSHAFLVAEIFGDELDPEVTKYLTYPEYNQRGTSYLPGDLTPLANVLGLAPNNYYNLATRKTQRYWPRHAVDNVKIDGIVKFVRCIFIKIC